MAASRLESYIAMLTDGDHPMITCWDHEHSRTDNTKYVFHSVKLLCELYVVTKKDPTNAKRVRCDYVDSFYIKEEDGDMMAFITVAFADSDVKLDKKTSVSIWKQYVQQDNSLVMSQNRRMPGHFYVNWFAYGTQHTTMDMRYTEYRNITVIKNIPYLAGRQIKRNDTFNSILRHKYTGETYFYTTDQEQVTKLLVGVGLTPQWKLTLKPFALRPPKTVKTVAVCLAFIRFLKDLFVTNTAAQTFLIDTLRHRMAEPVRFVLLDADSLVNEVFAPPCDLCENTMVRPCTCETRNQYFETLDFVDALCVIVSSKYNNLTGPLCQPAQALAALLPPRRITVVSYDKLPPLLAGEDFDGLVDEHKVPSTQRAQRHWTVLADNQDSVLRLSLPTPPDSE